MKYLCMLVIICLTRMAGAAETELQAQVVNGKAYVQENAPQEAYQQIMTKLKDKPDGMYVFLYDGYQVKMKGETENPDAQHQEMLDALRKKIDQNKTVETPAEPTPAHSTEPSTPSYEKTEPSTPSYERTEPSTPSYEKTEPLPPVPTMYGPQWEVRDWTVIIGSTKFKLKDYSINTLITQNKKKTKLVYSKKHYRMASGKVSSQDKTLLAVREAWLAKIKDIQP